MTAMSTDDRKYNSIGDEFSSTMACRVYRKRGQISIIPAVRYIAIVLYLIKLRYVKDHVTYTLCHLLLNFSNLLLKFVWKCSFKIFLLQNEAFLDKRLKLPTILITFRQVYKIHPIKVLLTLNDAILSLYQFYFLLLKFQAGICKDRCIISEYLIYLFHRDLSIYE